MDAKTTGLILRTRPLTETSLIVHWLTKDFGRMATVAKGARRPKSPMRGKLDLFFQADFSFIRSRRSDLHLLREVTLRATWPVLRRDLESLRQAAYCAALVELATETDSPLPGLSDHLCGLLGQLEKGPPHLRLVLAFELRLLGELGLMPDLQQTSLSPEVREMARLLSTCKWSGVMEVKAREEQVTEMGRYLAGFLGRHLGRVPLGRPD